MKKLITLLLILISFTASAQVYTKQPWYGLQVARVQADSVLTVPSGLGSLRQSFNSKQLRYNESDSSLYVWTGFNWVKQSGGGSGSVGTWQQVLTQGDSTTIRPRLIKSTFTTPFLEVRNSANGGQLFLSPGTSTGTRFAIFPPKGGRLAIWDNDSVKCVNDSLYAWKDGEQYWTGATCSGSGIAQGLQDVLNRDSSLNRDNTINAKNHTLVIDSANNFVVSAIEQFDIFSAKDSTFDNINGGVGGVEIQSRTIVNKNVIRLKSVDNPNKGIDISTTDSIRLLVNPNDNTPYQNTTTDTTGKKILMLNEVGALVTASPSIVGGGSTVDTTSLSNRIDAKKANNDTTAQIGYTPLWRYNKGKDSLASLIGSASGWGLTGNSGTTAANFIGTTDSRSLRVRTNNVERLVIDSIGNVGLGITSPTSLFQLSKSGINATQKDSFGITLSTPDAATSGNPKYSPPIVFAGKNFNTTTSASYYNLWRVYNKAVSGVNFNGSGSLVFENSYNGGAYAERMQITGGALTAQLIVPSVATNYINAKTGGIVNFVNRIYVIDAGANGFVGAVYIGGNPDYIAASAQLDVASTTKGFLPPRMTTVQRDAISSPAAGLVIYNTSTNKHQGYNGSTWNDFY